MIVASPHPYMFDSSWLEKKMQPRQTLTVQGLPNNYPGASCGTSISMPRSLKSSTLPFFLSFQLFKYDGTNLTQQQWIRPYI